MKQHKLKENEMEKIAIIHEVLSAGNEILEAQKRLKNAMQIMVNYAGEVAYEEHILIITQIEKATKELDCILEADKTLLTEADLTLLDN